MEVLLVGKMATVIISERQDEINAVLHPRLQILQVLFIYEKKFTVIFILITNMNL